MPSSGFLSPDSFSLIHSREASDSSESYSSLDLADDISSDDEIVWSPSSGNSSSPGLIRSQGAFSPAAFSDDDVVVLSRPRSAAERFQSLAAPGSVDALANTLNNLQVSSRSSAAASPARKGSRPVTTTSASETAASVKAAKAEKKARKKAKRARRKAKKEAKKAKEVKGAEGRLSSSSTEDTRSVVDDVSEAGGPSAYDEAVQYVTEILAQPTVAAHNSNLKLHHALIIELGLAPTAKVSSLSSAVHILPNSLTKARAILKQHVFLNVCDYLANRQKGLDALRQVMHPSRKALAKAIRGGKRMPAKEVKKSGLGVFLVTCYR
ncbi:hypothetical protein BXZ70DRAFT_281201 [Cristinia sonorae]|uniref:Uncharacterized protein n=1 Tax=Cristinia sonorae TaxID=1940300 RepID=A0A8K0UXV8_9AGAR|nr:hypothetical protein BXZ70DRAFT_281201 [Cristinia sonorae]